MNECGKNSTGTYFTSVLSFCLDGTRVVPDTDLAGYPVKNKLHIYV